MVSFKTKLLQEIKIEKRIEVSKYTIYNLNETFRQRARAKMHEVREIIFSLFRDFNFVYYILYIIFAVLAITNHVFFLTFHLMDIVIRSPLLLNLLSAIYQPREQLILTLILFLVFEYMFSLMTFAFFYHEMPDWNCTGSLINCYIIHID